MILLVLLLFVINLCASQSPHSSLKQEDPAVARFRDYLRINTAHPDPNYGPAIEWLRSQAEEIGLDFRTEDYELPHAFAVWMTWNGTRPDLPSILMDSHMDVVAVDESKWNYPPFSAFKDENGNIFARGAQDMKVTTAATLEAIRRLKASGFRPLRTLHILILPDEELYSRGVKAFVNSTTFQDMNVGFAFDEGMFSGGDSMRITYAEKSVWQFNFTVYGKSAHGSTMPEVTAGQKLQVVINRLMEYRQTQLDLVTDPADLQNVTSLNLVRIGGGMGNNIIPDELWASFDMRIVTKPGWNLTDVEDMLNSIAAEAGNDTKIDFLVKSFDYAQTPPNDENVWWTTLQNTCRKLNTTCVPFIPSGVTDGRYIRNTGVPVFGVNTTPNTVSLAHQDNEYVNEANFLHGIDRWVEFIRDFSSLL